MARDRALQERIPGIQRRIVVHTSILAETPLHIHPLQQVARQLSHLAALALHQGHVAGDVQVLEVLRQVAEAVVEASTYGLSIWKGSPVRTILVPSPARVRMVFTSCGSGSGPRRR